MNKTYVIHWHVEDRTKYPVRGGYSYVYALGRRQARSKLRDGVQVHAGEKLRIERVEERL